MLTEVRPGAPVTPSLQRISSCRIGHGRPPVTAKMIVAPQARCRPAPSAAVRLVGHDRARAGVPAIGPSVATTGPRGWGPLSPTRGPNWRLHRLRSGRVTETTTLCSPRSIPDKSVAIYNGLRNLGQCHACRLYEVVFEKLHNATVYRYGSSLRPFGPTSEPAEETGLQP